MRFLKKKKKDVTGKMEKLGKVCVKDVTLTLKQAVGNFMYCCTIVGGKRTGWEMCEHEKQNGGMEMIIFL